MNQEFELRKERFNSELRYIFSELYEEKEEEYGKLLRILEEAFAARPAALKRKDRAALNNVDRIRHSSVQDRLIRGKAVKGTLDLKGNFNEPAVFLRAVSNLLKAANEGAELVEITGGDQIFRIPGAGVQNKTRVHITFRIFRICTELVCPSVFLYGNFPQDGEDYTPYFGTPEKPQLHLQPDRSLLSALWHTVATEDTRLLQNMLNQANQLPENRIFVRERIEEQGIFWDLDYGYLNMLQMGEESHRKFLQSYFTGSFKKSPASAHRIKNRKTGKWGVRGTEEEMSGSRKKVTELLDAFLLMQSGVPVPTGMHGETKLLEIRRKHHVFDCGADIWSPGCDHPGVVGMGRYKDGQKFYGLYNFTGEEQVFSLQDPGLYENLLTGKEVQIVNLIRLQPYHFAWLLRR